MREIIAHVKKETHQGDPDSDVEMVDAPSLGTTSSASLAQALQALARSSSYPTRSNRYNKFRGRDADGDSYMSEAPPLVIA